MLVRFPLTIENKRVKRTLPTWLINLAGLVVAVLSVALTYIVLAAITEVK